MVRGIITLRGGTTPSGSLGRASCVESSRVILLLACSNTTSLPAANHCTKYTLSTFKVERVPDSGALLHPDCNMERKMCTLVIDDDTAARSA